MNRLRKILIIFTIIVLFLFINFLIELDNKIVNEEKIVTKIIDGDTIIVEGGETLRLLGMDCDERGKECYGAAKNRIEELLLGKTVTLESDAEDKDQYGRSLRYIFLENQNINSLLVKEGYCIARFVKDSKYKKEIQDAEKYAIENKIGCKWEG